MSTRFRPASPRARRLRRAVPVLGVALASIAAAACQPDTAAPEGPVSPAPTTVAPAPPTSVPAVTPPAPEPVVVPATDATLDGWNVNLYADVSGRSVIRYDWVGKATFDVVVPHDTDHLSVVVKGDQCDGAPAYTLTVDSLPIATDTAPTADWTTRTYSQPLLAGTHRVEIEYTNDHQPLFPQTCNRNLYVDRVSASVTSPLPNKVVANAAIPSTGFVHQSGTQLLDGANRPLELRGVNLGGWLLWEGWMWGQGFDYVGQTEMMKNLTSLVGAEQAQQFQRDVFDNYVTGDDFRAISNYGFNVARVPFNYRMLEDDSAPFVYKQAGWDVLDNVVRWAEQHNVYLVLDMHAAPCSQSLAFISDWNGSTYMWLSQQCQERATAMWKAIAARYADEKIIAGYDLLNETVTGEQQLLGWYQKTTAAIREVDPNHTIIYEGNNLARDFNILKAPLDPNMMISAHDYPWMTMGQDLEDRMPGYVAAATQVNAPMWIGEFGQSSYEDIDRYVDTFDQAPTFAGFAQWSWKQAPGAATLQNVKHTAASKKLVEWMTVPSRPRPTPTEAQQGMADFIDVIKFVNTVPDARTRQILAGN